MKSLRISSRLGIAVLLLAAIILTGCFSEQAYPTPANFPDYETLAGWVENHAQQFEAGSGAEAWYKAALAVQREAAKDGYLVSAVITMHPTSASDSVVWCTAVAGEALYWWYPEDTECYLLMSKEELGLGTEYNGD